jgi:hypothetical protein
MKRCTRVVVTTLAVMVVTSDEVGSKLWMDNIQSRKSKSNEGHTTLPKSWRYSLTLAFPEHYLFSYLYHDMQSDVQPDAVRD